MKTLTKHVAARLEARAFCVVFENDLERLWPSNKITHAKRKKEIQSFAESQGWTAEVLDGGFGTRAIFREGLEPGSA
jgi:hypothetical protein